MGLWVGVEDPVVYQIPANCPAGPTGLELRQERRQTYLQKSPERGMADFGPAVRAVPSLGKK